MLYAWRISGVSSLVASAALRSEAFIGFVANARLILSAFMSVGAEAVEWCSDHGGSMHGSRCIEGFEPAIGQILEVDEPEDPALLIEHRDLVDPLLGAEGDRRFKEFVG